MLVCYETPASRSQDLIGFYGHQNVLWIDFISDSLLLAKMRHVYLDKFGKPDVLRWQKVDPVTTYWSIFDVNGSIMPVPSLIEQMSEVTAYPQWNGRRIFIFKKKDDD